MKKYLKKSFATIILATVIMPFGAHASIFGEETAVLVQILSNAVSQLQQLRMILAEGQDTLNLMRDINRGINDSLSVAKTNGIHLDPRLYEDLKKFGDVTQKIEELYGVVVDSPLAPVQKNTDETVAEAVSMNNNIYDYTEKLDAIGEEIKKYSHQVSPGGASKLTAESLGIVIHVLNEQLRASATGLKLQAQTLAIQNKKEKDETAEYLSQVSTLKNEMVSIDPKFEVPRF